MKKSKRILLISSIILVLLWALGSFLAGSSLILPGPQEVLGKLCQLALSGSFYHNLALTLGRGFAGMLMALSLSGLLGLIAGIWPMARYSFLPLLVTLRSAPVISVILLALIWFGSDWVPVFIALLTMFPILASSILDGLNDIDPDLLVMARNYRVPRTRVIRDIYLPGIASFFFNGLSNAMGFGWRAVIIGEVLSQPLHGIGSRMRDAQNYLEVSELIAWTLVAILIGSVFEWMSSLLKHSLMPWKEEVA